MSGATLFQATRVRRRQTDRRASAETRILDAAIRLIAERGFEGLTLAQVGEEAGFSRGLPAHYFGPKEALLVAVARYVTRQYQDSLAELPSIPPGLPRLRAAIEEYARGVRSPGNRALGLLVTQAVVRPELAAEIAAMNARGFRALEALIQGGVETGNIRADVSARDQAQVIYSFLRGLMAFAALDPSFEPERIAQTFIEDLEARIAAAP